jgi:hypothetical protein
MYTWPNLPWLRRNPRMQPTGRGGPELLAGTSFLKAKQWKR